MQRIDRDWFALASWAGVGGAHLKLAVTRAYGGTGSRSMGGTARKAHSNKGGDGTVWGHRGRGGMVVEEGVEVSLQTQQQETQRHAAACN